MTLLNDLEQLDGLKCQGKGFRLRLRRSRSNAVWVSGMPYPTTGFVERAFVFPSEASALWIAKNHFPDATPEVRRVEA